MTPIETAVPAVLPLLNWQEGKLLFPFSLNKLELITAWLRSEIRCTLKGHPDRVRKEADLKLMEALVERMKAQP